MSEDLCFLSVTEAGQRLRGRTLSPVELTKAFLARIARLDPALHAYITICPERALQDAHCAETELFSGRDRGPLHGIPVAVKDIIATAGIRTTGHSRRLIDFVPEVDATVMQRLTAAGAVLLGKAAAFELAIGGPSNDLPFPLAVNPWHPDAYTGGSSSGSAVAVAAGLAMAAIGTDTGGSVRNPAAHCGVVGLKPTFGRISKVGIQPLSPRLDHVGTITWSVEDAALLLGQLTGFDPRDPASVNLPAAHDSADLVRLKDLKGIRIGVIDDWYKVDPVAGNEVRIAMEDAIRLLIALGAEIEPVKLSPLEDYEAVLLVMILGDAYALFEADLRDAPAQFGQTFRDRVQMGALLRASDYSLWDPLESTCRHASLSIL